MKKIVSTLMLITLLLSGCGKGFQTPNLSSSADGDNSGSGTNDGSGGGSSTPAATWDKVEVDGYPSGGAYAGRLVVFVDKEKQSLFMVLPIPALVPILKPIQMPDAPGAYLTTYTDANGGISMAVNIPLHYIVRGGNFVPGQKLPSGDPLPFVPAGELPGFGVQFPQMPDYRIHIYIGVNIAAAFVELPDFGLPIGGIFPVKNKTKTKVVGAIGYITPKGNFPGGMYLATQIPDDMARLIDELIRW